MCGLGNLFISTLCSQNLFMETNKTSLPILPTPANAGVLTALQNANEKLLVSNSEWQNLNEELAASKEALQKLNEQLTVLNGAMLQMEEENFVARKYAAAIVTTIREPLLVLDKHLRIKTANKAFYDTFNIAEKDTEGVLIYDLANRQWNIAALRTLLEEILPTEKSFTDFEVTHTFPLIGERVILLNASEIMVEKGDEKLILLAIKDITDVTVNAREIKDREGQLLAIMNYKSEAEKELLQNAVDAATGELREANSQLLFQNSEKEKRAAELAIANQELAFQNEEKEKRAAELSLANTELMFQYVEKGRRAAELVIANNELKFENEEKEKRAAELIIANTELAFQNVDKEKRAAELATANTELLFQNAERKDRALELIAANIELAFQSEEKEKRAAELIIANNELIFQNSEKEKRAAELTAANKELASFNYLSSHDLQEPLRKIQTFTSLIFENEYPGLSVEVKKYFQRISSAAERMQALINGLLVYSHTDVHERVFEQTSLNNIIADVKSELAEIILEKKADIKVGKDVELTVNRFQLKQLVSNLLTNALKFSRTGVPPKIILECNETATSVHGTIDEIKYFQITCSDNGIGFDMQYKDRIFEIFRRLHSKEAYPGTGIGLAVVKKIVENHNGFISASGELNKGATFHVYLPCSQTAQQVGK